MIRKPELSQAAEQPKGLVHVSLSSSHQSPRSQVPTGRASENPVAAISSFSDLENTTRRHSTLICICETGR